jgi:hypothetical protein
MAIADSNEIIKTYLDTCATLTALIGGATPRIYCPRLPENATLPAVSFFTRGGTSTPYIPGIINPSVQFDCWAEDVEAGGVVTTSGPIKAREVYRALYDNLQGIQDQMVGAYKILSAIEEVQGQDLVDVEIPGYFRVLSFFSIMIRVE